MSGEDIRKILQQINKNKNSTSNPFDVACNMRQAEFGLFQEAIKLGDEASIGFICDDYLSKYTTHVSSNSVNNYTAEVLKLLKLRDKPVNLSDWNIYNKSPTDIIRNPCSSHYVDCSYSEITNSDLLQLKNLSKNTEKEISLVENNFQHSKTSFDESSRSENKTNRNSKVNFLPKSLSTVQNVPSTSACIGNNSNTIENSTKNVKQSELKLSFRTAQEELHIQNMKKFGNANSSNQQQLFSYGATKKSLGARRSVKSNFTPPIKATDESEKQTSENSVSDDPMKEQLKNIDPKMVELIRSEIMNKFKPVDWNDIAGLEYAKTTIQEAVVWPLLRPDIFKGLRRPPRGILLFGPPGTGKTLIGKCIASQSKSTFFSISASSLTSKWIGEGEKMVRALFAVAAVYQPAVIFIDEIDSLLCQRSETEHESSRRIKTEFLVQLDGAATSEDDRILVVGATNRPQELDEAARRRLVRRLYIPLPELDARLEILKNLLKSVRNVVTEQQMYEISKLAEGYSGADMESLCREASMEPIRSIPPSDIPFFNENEVRPVHFDDFRSALNRIRASISQNDLQQYVDWNKTYGSGNSR